jgi:hypothetical protein
MGGGEMSQHTPGPWFVAQDGSYKVASVTSVTGIYADEMPDTENIAADAGLIAAAPELLAFAKEFLSDYQSEDGMMSMKHYAGIAAKAVIKATGEPHA